MKPTDKQEDSENQLELVPEQEKFNQRMENFSDIKLSEKHRRALEDIRTQHNRMLCKAEEYLKKWEAVLNLLQESNSVNQNYKQKYYEAQEQFFETRKELDRRNEVIRILKGTN